MDNTYDFEIVVFENLIRSLTLYICDHVLFIYFVGFNFMLNLILRKWDVITSEPTFVVNKTIDFPLDSNGDVSKLWYQLLVLHCQ